MFNPFDDVVTMEICNPDIPTCYPVPITCVKEGTLIGPTYQAFGSSSKDSYIVRPDDIVSNENLIGSLNDDVLVESSGTSNLNGSLGDDIFILRVGGENDSVIGSLGEDTVIVENDIGEVIL